MSWKAVGACLTIVSVLLLPAGCKPDSESSGRSSSESETDPAAQSAEVVVERDIEPKVDEVLREMGEALGKVKAFTVTTDRTMDVFLDDGQMVQMGQGGAVEMVRPNKLHATVVGDEVDHEMWFDGQTLTIFDADTNTFVSVEAPGDVASMVDMMAIDHDLTMPLTDFIFQDTRASLTAEVLEGRYLGLTELGESSCHHLAFRQETIDWQLWVDAGETPTPRRLLITYMTEPGEPQFSVTFSDWDLSPDEAVADEVFEFVAPEEAEEVSMDELLEGSQP